MVEQAEVYKCFLCGNTVVVIAVGGGELVCCGKAMDFLEKQTEGDKSPKYLPIIEKTDDGYVVKVGESEHPMEDEHYIQTITLVVGNESFGKSLKPGDKQEFVVKTDAEGPIIATALCNLHGYWENQL